eukprot:6911286-Prymnesium_polylepis.1
MRRPLSIRPTYADQRFRSSTPRLRRLTPCGRGSAALKQLLPNREAVPTLERKSWAKAGCWNNIVGVRTPLPHYSYISNT